ncbi:hypothetical protein MKEN_00918700 [Mycena kentingensis (nom. inval.)]|nr:hypothetical protein MKEN_00918700 [Mycena kentingensis (nom. inval.)]
MQTRLRTYCTATNTHLFGHCILRSTCDVADIPHSICRLHLSDAPCARFVGCSLPPATSPGMPRPMFTAVLCLCFFAALSLARPLTPRTVYSPPITTPTSKTVWTVGTKQTVTWDATGIPQGVFGKIQLGFLTEESENLSQILAEGFNLTDEKVEITVPNVVERSNYIIVLFGDSGNTSPEFTIQGGAATSTSGTTTKPASSSTTSKPTTTKRVGSNTPTPPIASVSVIPVTSESGSTMDSASTPSTSASGSASALAASLSDPSPAPSGSEVPSTGGATKLLTPTMLNCLVGGAALLIIQTTFGF